MPQEKRVMPAVLPFSFRLLLLRCQGAHSAVIVFEAVCVLRDTESGINNAIFFCVVKLITVYYAYGAICRYLGVPRHAAARIALHFFFLTPPCRKRAISIRGPRCLTPFLQA